MRLVAAAVAGRAGDRRPGGQAGAAAGHRRIDARRPGARQHRAPRRARGGARDHLRPARRAARRRTARSGTSRSSRPRCRAMPVRARPSWRSWRESPVSRKTSWSAATLRPPTRTRQVRVGARPHRRRRSSRSTNSSRAGRRLDRRSMRCRTYVDPLIFGHVLGYVGPLNDADLQRLRAARLSARRGGRQGRRRGRASRSLLRGTDGWADVEVDARGQIVKTLATQPPVPGHSVYLSIDASLQRATAQCAGGGARSGMARRPARRSSSIRARARCWRWSACPATTPTCSRTASARPTTRSLHQRPGSAAAEPRDRRPVRTRIDLQDGHRDRRSAGGQDHAANAARLPELHRRQRLDLSQLGAATTSAT